MVAMMSANVLKLYIQGHSFHCMNQAQKPGLYNRPIHTAHSSIQNGRPNQGSPNLHQIGWVVSAISGVATGWEHDLRVSSSSLYVSYPVHCPSPGQVWLVMGPNSA